MRKKTLAAFAAVYAAVCLTYGAAKGMDRPVSTKAAEQLSGNEILAAETQVTAIAPETVTTQLTEETFQIQTEAPEEPLKESITEQTENEEKESQIEEPDEAPAVPAQEEHSGKRRYGGGRGCTLLDRGARKQSSV